MHALTVRIALLLVSAIALVGGLFLGEGRWVAPPAGLPTEGPVVGWAVDLAALVCIVLGTWAFGALLASAFVTTQNGEQVGEVAQRDLLRVVKIAGIWSAAELLNAVLVLASALGLKLSEVLNADVLRTYIWALPLSRNHLFAAALAFVVSLIAALFRSLNATAVASAFAAAAIASPLLNAHASSLGDHSLALTSTMLHVLAMSAWVGGLVAVVPHVRRGDLAVLPRYSKLATVSVGVLVVSGLAAAYVRIDSLSDSWVSGYGRLVLVKIFLLVAVLLIAIKIRSNLTATSVSKLLALELLVMALAMGIGVAQTSTAPSRSAQEFASAGEELLGWGFPPPPSVAGLIFGWQPEWFMLSLATTFAALYLLGVRRLSQAEIPWSRLRSVSFFIGILLVLWTSSSGIAKYAQLTFSAHMVQHMVLSMLAPIFLVLGAPITLALRALATSTSHAHRSAREWLLASLHSRYANLLTHPIVVLVVFTVGLYGVYFTNLFAKMMSGHAGHVFMEIHFLLTGLLFSYVVIGVDPSPRKVPYGARLMLVLLALSLHAFFAIAIMQSQLPIGAQWYSQVQPPWLTSALADTYAGGGVAWALGEIPTLILVVVVAIQWSRNDSKTAKRLDRAADRDGDQEREAYNAYLRSLKDRTN